MPHRLVQRTVQQCVSCPNGKWVTQGNAGKKDGSTPDACIDCVAGKYGASSMAADQCINCAAGRFAAGTGTSSARLVWFENTRLDQTLTR